MISAVKGRNFQNLIKHEGEKDENLDLIYLVLDSELKILVKFENKTEALDFLVELDCEECFITAAWQFEGFDDD